MDFLLGSQNDTAALHWQGARQCQCAMVAMGIRWDVLARTVMFLARVLQYPLEAKAQPCCRPPRPIIERVARPLDPP